jgi:beta-lactamase class A
MSKKIIAFQIFIIIVLVALLFLYKGYRAPQGDTYIVAPITATTSIPADDTKMSGFPLINPGVTANLGKHFIINFKPLEDQLRGINDRYHQKTYIYFAFLNNAAWLGFNEDKLFTAASTVKVPLAMAIMKMVEQGKLSLSQSYTLDQLDLDSHFGDLYQVGADNSFTLEELLKIMLENSDNTAMNALYKVLKLIGVDDPFGDVYNFMGWQGVTDIGQVPKYNMINLKTLSNMFIALYNAKYDNVADSQQILNYLDNSTSNDELPAGVPQDISVAHKFGVNITDQTYSDCGIVYAPNRNYLLCLGSQGAPKKTADAFMVEASKAVYQYVINN